MSIKLKRLGKFLKSYQKKEVLRRIILENKNMSDSEKQELWSKLESFKDDEIEKAWNSVISNLERG